MSESNLKLEINGTKYNFEEVTTNDIDVNTPLCFFGNKTYIGIAVPNEPKKTEHKDYEILEFQSVSADGQYVQLYKKKGDGRFWYNNNPNHFDEDFCLKMVNEKRHFSEHIWNINSVKRLSDGEVFSVGDEVNSYMGNGKIQSFYIYQGENMCISIGNNIGGNIGLFSKVKQPIPLLSKDEIESCIQRIDVMGYNIGFLDETKLKQLYQSKIV